MISPVIDFIVGLVLGWLLAQVEDMYRRRRDAKTKVSEVHRTQEWRKPESSKWN